MSRGQTSLPLSAYGVSVQYNYVLRRQQHRTMRHRRRP